MQRDFGHRGLKAAGQCRESGPCCTSWVPSEPNGGETQTSVQFSLSVVSDCLQPHGLQHANKGGFIAPERVQIHSPTELLVVVVVFLMPSVSRISEIELQRILAGASLPRARLGMVSSIRATSFFLKTVDGSAERVVVQ